MPSRLASFLTLFRLAQPELFGYFEDEQVPYLQVGMAWMSSLLARELWLSDLLRLWGDSMHHAHTPDADCRCLFCRGRHV